MPMPTPTATRHFSSAVFALLCVLHALPAVAIFPGQNGRIVYVGDDFGNTPPGGGFPLGYKLYIVDASGSNPTKLTPSTNYQFTELSPTPSPDGTRVAFHGTRRHSGVLGDYILISNVVGDTTEQEITEGVKPAWSPNGEELAFQRDGKIWARNLASGAERALAEYGYSPAWSPDGTRIAFEADGGIWVKNLTTGVETRITFPEAPNDILDEDPDWSPDGTTIVFERAQQSIGGGAYQSDVYVVGSSGGDTQRLTDRTVWMRTPCGRPMARRSSFRVAVTAATASGTTTSGS